MFSVSKNIGSKLKPRKSTDEQGERYQYNGSNISKVVPMLMRNEISNSTAQLPVQTQRNEAAEDQISHDFRSDRYEIKLNLDQEEIVISEDQSNINYDTGRNSLKYTQLVKGQFQPKALTGNNNQEHQSRNQLNFLSPSQRVPFCSVQEQWDVQKEANILVTEKEENAPKSVISVDSDKREEPQKSNTGTYSFIQNNRNLNLGQQLNNLMQEAVNQKILTKVLDISEYQVQFRAKNLLKFMFYHLIWFYTGFTMLLVLIPIDSFALAKNMSFWFTTKNKISLWTQIYQWLLLLTIHLLFLWKYLYESDDDDFLRNIYPEQLLFLDIQVVIRCFIIAVRYSYASELRLYFLTKDSQEGAYIAQDLFFYQWREFNPFGVYSEIQSALWRNKVIKEYFLFNLYEKPKEEIKQRLTNPNYYDESRANFSIDKYSEIARQHKRSIRMRQSIRAMTSRESIAMDNFDAFTIPEGQFVAHPEYQGDLMVREIALQSSAHQTPTGIMLLLIVLVRLWIPFIVRYGQKGIFFDFDTHGIIYVIIENLLLLTFLMQNFGFVLFGFTDFQRRNYMITAIGALLNPNKLDYDLKFQIFPTLDPTTINSLYTWLKMRECIMDLGSKYMKRVLIYSSVFMGIYSFYAIVFLLYYFEIMQLTINPIINSYALFDIVVVLVVITSMLYQGAVINSKFSEHKIQLISIKNNLLFIKLKLDEFEKLVQNTYDEYFNMLRKLLQDRLRGLSKEDKQTHIENVIDYIDNMIEKIDIDSEGKPLKLLGLTASFALMNTIYTGIVTVAFALLQQYFTQDKDESSQADL